MSDVFCGSKHPDLDIACTEARHHTDDLHRCRVADLEMTWPNRRRRVGVGTGLYIVRGEFVASTAERRGYTRYELLMGKRNGAHGLGKYSVPGGRLEFGESPRRCAVRETREECGLVVPESALNTIEPTSDVFSDDHHDITLNFEARYTPSMGEPRAMEPHKCAEWVWVPFEELSRLPLFLCVSNLLVSGWMLDARSR